MFVKRKEKISMCVLCGLIELIKKNKLKFGFQWP